MLSKTRVPGEAHETLYHARRLCADESVAGRGSPGVGFCEGARMDGRVLGECRGRARARASNGLFLPARPCSVSAGPSKILRQWHTSSCRFVRPRPASSSTLPDLRDKRRPPFSWRRCPRAKSSSRTRATTFPSASVIRLTAEGNLAARIEGEERGEVRTIDFPMRRIDCESQMPTR